ncbi:MAG: energy transducer TonB [Bdellovibrionota bacterium]|nr:energy transducer TonB [Bdellovibrionota bacterium]
MVLRKSSHIYAGAVLLGGPVTFCLFLLMAHLVSQPAKLGESSETTVIDFSRTSNSSQLQTKTRQLPKAPPKPKEAPKMPKMAVSKATNDAPAPKMAMNVPMMATSLSLGDGPYLGGSTGASQTTGDRAVMPLVRIEPQYPRKAAMRGIEGYVRIMFDVNTAGGVENVQIVESRPPRIFDQATKRAVLKWKYQPKLVDGKPVPMKGLRVELPFKLQR